MKIIFLLLICSFAYGQQYEYAEAVTAKTGRNGKDNVTFTFSKDSTDFYNQLKIKNIVDAMQLLDSKGWELITVNTSFGSLLVTTAYFRRRYASLP